jgi:hypothetical protein
MSLGVAWRASLLMLGVIAVAPCREDAEELRSDASIATEDALVRLPCLDDLDRWRRSLEEVHPAPFHDVDRREFDTVFSEAKGRLASCAPTAVYESLAPLAASLGDSHTSVDFPSTQPDGAPTPAVLRGLPIDVEGRAIIVHGASGPVSLARIGGLTATAAVERWSPLASGETPAAREVALGTLFGLALSHETAETIDGQPIALVTDAAPPNAVHFEWREDLGWLTVRTFAGPEAFYVEWFDEVLAEVGSRPLVVDVSRNPGGSTRNAELLLERLAARPFRLFAAKRWRLSRQLVAHLEMQPEAEVPWGEDRIVHVPVSQPIRAVDEGPRRVIFLAGPATQSAAMMLINAVVDCGLFPVIGEPPGSPPNYFGEVIPVSLSSSKLTARFSSAAFLRANGDVGDRGVVTPDVLADVYPRGSDAATPVVLRNMASDELFLRVAARPGCR